MKENFKEYFRRKSCLRKKNKRKMEIGVLTNKKLMKKLTERKIEFVNLIRKIVRRFAGEIFT